MTLQSISDLNGHLGEFSHVLRCLIQAFHVSLQNYWATGRPIGLRRDDAAPRSDNDRMHIRAVREAEFPTLQAIERAAGLMFCDIGMPEIAQYDPWPLPVMAAHSRAGRLWVAAGDQDQPVAYLIADPVDGCLQIKQVTVHPSSARRGLDRALLDHAAVRAATDGLPALTLTTFAHVPWNAPYYTRCGFKILADAEITRAYRRSGRTKPR